MIKRFWRCALILAVGMSLGWLGCMDDDEGDKTPTGPTDVEGAPELPKPMGLTGPQETDANKADSVAIAARRYVQIANFYPQMALESFAQIQEMEPERSGTTFIWNTVTSAGMQVRLAGTPTMEGADWTIVLNGGLFRDWTAATGHTNLTGTSGTFTIYQLNTTEPMGDLEWREDGTVIGRDIQVTDILTGTTSTYYVINHPDGSGSVTVSQEGTQVFAATWDPEGVVTPA